MKLTFLGLTDPRFLFVINTVQLASADFRWMHGHASHHLRFETAARDFKVARAFF